MSRLHYKTKTLSSMNVQRVLVFHSVWEMQTEDQLTRDMLAATAGFINCTGGVNGKVVVAVKKSWVIDLKAEA